MSRAEFERLADLDPIQLTDVQRAHRFYYLIMAGWGGELDYPRFQTSITDGGQEVPYTNPPIQTGVCFFKASDQDVWEDASQYSEGSTQIPINICLRATVDESALAPVPAFSSLSVGLMMAGLAPLIVLFTVRRVRRSQR